MAAIFPDNFNCIFLNEIVQISIKISLEFVPKVQINNNSALVQIMAWRQPGDKLLSEPMIVSFLTHICVTRPQWVNGKQSDYTVTGNYFHKHTYRPLSGQVSYLWMV